MSHVDLLRSREDLSVRRDLNDRDFAIAGGFSPLGDYVFVALQGSNRVDVLDAYTRALVTSNENVGRAPQGLAFSRDGRLFVHSFLSREILVYDVSELFASSGRQTQHLAAVSTVAQEEVGAHIVLEVLDLFTTWVRYGAPPGSGSGGASKGSTPRPSRVSGKRLPIFTTAPLPP